jgi:hypothetical protein
VALRKLKHKGPQGPNANTTAMPLSHFSSFLCWVTFSAIFFSVLFLLRRLLVEWWFQASLYVPGGPYSACFVHNMVKGGILQFQL